MGVSQNTTPNIYRTVTVTKVTSEQRARKTARRKACIRDNDLAKAGDIYKVKVPENLDIERLFITNPPTTFKANSRSREILKCYCSILVNLRLKHGGYNDKYNGYTPLYSPILKSIHSKYKLYFDYLVATGVLQCDNYHIEGIKSVGYKLTPNYIGVELKTIVIKDFVLRKCVRVQWLDKIADKKQQLREVMHIVKWVIDGGLEIDLAGADRWISQKMNQEFVELLFSNKKKKRLKAKKLYDVWQASGHFVEQLNDRGFSVADITPPDPFGNRIHYPLSFQRSELREFITYKRQRLASDDVKNSQPYFGTHILNPFFWKSEKTETPFLKLWDINKDLYKQVKQQAHIVEGIKWLESSQTTETQGVARDAFIEDARSGLLYEKVLQKFREQIPDDSPIELLQRVRDRKGVKKEFLRTLYCHNDCLTRPFYLPSRIIVEMYPHAFGFFQLLKRDNYKLIAKIIQQVESHCVLKLICGRIATERPELPIFTIHDSVVTTVGNEQYVKSVIEEVLTAKIGQPPQVKIEFWTPDNLS